MTLCKSNGTMFEIPISSSPNLAFHNFKNILTAPFVIYCDMETFIQEEEIVKRGKIISRCHHVQISVGALMVCRDQPGLGSDPFLYTGIDCVDVLMNYLNDEAVHLKHVYDNVNMPCHWGEPKRIAYDVEKKCAMCKRAFSPHGIKVRDHCHISGRYGLLCVPSVI